MNTKLLNQVALAILREPLKFNISNWAAPNVESPCGTTACIAGHAFAINRKYKRLKRLLVIENINSWAISDKATSFLRLSPAQAQKLFFRWAWPEPFSQVAYDPEADVDTLAENAFWRIQHFIATEGAE